MFSQIISNSPLTGKKWVKSTRHSIFCIALPKAFSSRKMELLRLGKVNSFLSTGYNPYLCSSIVLIFSKWPSFPLMPQYFVPKSLTWKVCDYFFILNTSFIWHLSFGVFIKVLPSIIIISILLPLPWICDANYAQMFSFF